MIYNFSSYVQLLVMWSQFSSSATDLYLQLVAASYDQVIGICKLSNWFPASHVNWESWIHLIIASFNYLSKNGHKMRLVTWWLPLQSQERTMGIQVPIVVITWKLPVKRDLSILYGSLFYWQLARQEVPSEELDLVVLCNFDASVLILLSETIENKPNLTLFLSWRKCDVIWGCHSQRSRTAMELIGVSSLFGSKVSVRSICLKHPTDLLPFQRVLGVSPKSWRQLC